MTRCRPTFLCIVYCILGIGVTRGSIECACSTKECKDNNKRHCTAESLCYVQHLRMDSQVLSDNIVRGCIENKVPILCENRRPERIGGPWPTLLCCAENHCNSEVVPTPAKWSLHPADGHRSRPTELPHSPVQMETERSREHQPANQKGALFSGKLKRGMSTVNPIFIAVPIAGACVLLAIIIFAIYVLKKDNIYVEDYQYHGNMPHNVNRVIVRDSFLERKSQYSDETDRSSSGSEARLLIKV